MGAARGLTYYSANYYPIDLDMNANFVVFQGILGGDMTVDQAAATYQDVITKWRSVHAADYRELQGLAEGLREVRIRKTSGGTDRRKHF